MSPLALRRGTVVSVEATGPVARIVVQVDKDKRPAIAYVDLTGPVEEGDEVVVNIAAAALGLGSGGFDIVHANLTRGLDADPDSAAHVMKLNYTSLQHGVKPVEARDPASEPIRLSIGVSAPVAVMALHAQLPCIAWAAAQAAPGARIGYVQTWGGALAGPLSDAVRELRERGFIAQHVTAGAAFGGQAEAMSVIGAIEAGFAERGWDGAIAGPGPGIVGSASALGHGGMAALESAHAALALGCRTIVVPRMSSGDPRERHRGLSHHSATVLELLLRPVEVALPEGERPDLPGSHTPIGVAVDLDGYRGAGLPARTMGRGIEEDQLFFRAALAGGVVLAEGLNDVRAR